MLKKITVLCWAYVLNIGKALNLNRA